jgi:amino acid transporter
VERQDTFGDRVVPPPPGEGYERLGGKRLSLIDVLAQSVGFMGPVFSAAFIIPLIIGVNAAARGAGTSAPLAVLLAGVGTFALGWIVAEYAKRIHAAGSLYDYVSDGLGTTIGAAAGWLYYGGTIILTTGLGLLIGGYVHDNLLPAFDVTGGLMPIWAWQVLFAVGLFLVLYFGVQISTRVQLTLALISVAVVLVYFLSVIIRLGGDNDFAKAFNPNPEPDGFTGILFGVLYGVLIFVGFETAANLAEETAEPKKSIPRAVLLSVVVVSVFYIIAAYTEIAGFGFDMSVITSPEVAGAPLFALGAPGGEFGSDFVLKLLLVVVFLDMLAVYVGAGVASTRGVFAMARDRRLPEMAAGVSPKYGTPVGAIVLLMVVQALLIAASEWWDALFALEGLPHYFSLFAWCATFGGFA